MENPRIYDLKEKRPTNVVHLFPSQYYPTLHLSSPPLHKIANFHFSAADLQFNVFTYFFLSLATLFSIYLFYSGEGIGMRKQQVTEFHVLRSKWILYNA